jgi:hypothetical protein
MNMVMADPHSLIHEPMDQKEPVALVLRGACDVVVRHIVWLLLAR